MQSSTFDIDSVKRRDYESQDDFMVRVGLLVMDGKLTWQMAADIFNNDTGKDYGECAYRKHFKSFYQGMQYQKQLGACGAGEANTCILSISDLHIPFQKPVETFKDFAGKVDVLQINGDVVDSQSLSVFSKVYRKSPMEEILAARQYMIDLIEMIHPERVVVNYGNHDIRFQNYFAKNLDTDILELMPRTSLELIFIDGFNHYNKELHTKVHYDSLKEVFDNSGIDIVYNDTWYSQIGKTIFCHPLAYSSGIMKTAEKAYRYFRDMGFEFDSIVLGHVHRIGQYDIGVSTMYEQGCCCETDKMNYTDGKLVPSQREGYIVVYQDESGKLLKDSTYIVRLN